MWGHIASAAAGELIGGLFGSSSAKKQNKAAAEAAERANAFTREQMQKRHQWEVADLKAAGLNPVLSAGGTPSIGGAAQAPVVGEMTDLANSAKNLGKIKLERDQAQASLEATRINNGKLIAETNQAEEQSKFNREMQKQAQAQTRAININSALVSKYGAAQAMAGIARDGGSAIGSILHGSSSAKDAWNPALRKSQSSSTNFNRSESTSKSESHNWHYKGKQP